MIVKKLGMVSGGGFPGAGYNERKVAEGVARLMAMENVDAAMRHKGRGPAHGYGECRCSHSS